MLDRLGVKKIINASGTLTVLGGNRLSSQVTDAMLEVSDSFVDMEELSVKAGAYVAELAGVPAAYITSGAASGLVISLSSLISKGNLDEMSKSTTPSSGSHNIVVQYPHTVGNPYYKLLEIAGVKIRIAGDDKGVSLGDIAQTIDGNTVAVVHFLFEPQHGEVNLEDVIKLSKERGTRVVVDAAAELPPATNLSSLVKAGADLVVFSGGKDIGAPSNTGVILASSLGLIENCRKIGPFSYLNVNGEQRTFIGRVFKVSKEDIVAFAAAFEQYSRTDHEGALVEMNRLAESIVLTLKESVPGVTVSKVAMQDGERTRPPTVPRVEIKSDNMSAVEITRKLKESDPPIYAICRDSSLQISLHCLNLREVEIITDKLIEILSTGR